MGSCFPRTAAVSPRICGIAKSGGGERGWYENFNTQGHRNEVYLTLKAKAFHYTNARLASVIYPENAFTCPLPHNKFVKITNPPNAVTIRASLLYRCLS